MKHAGPENWMTRFRVMYDSAVEKYKGGLRTADSIFGVQEVGFLASIGCRPQELFDFVEDWCQVEEPSFEAVLAITSVRREYFLTEQAGQWSDHRISMDSLPSMGEKLGGYAWLPRIIAKAKAKLHGEMPPQLMYGCGGDRPFLDGLGIGAGEFLRLVWKFDFDERQILDAVQKRAVSRS